MNHNGFETMEKTFTVGELIDALKENGYKQAFHSFYENEWTPGKKPSACALGQVGVILGVNGATITTKNSFGQDYHMWERIRSSIIHMNDIERTPVSQIGERIEERYEGYRNILLRGNERKFDKRRWRKVKKPIESSI